MIWPLSLSQLLYSGSIPNTHEVQLFLQNKCAFLEWNAASGNKVTLISLGLLDWIAQFKNQDNLTLHAFISTKYKNWTILGYIFIKTFEI